MSQPSMFPAFGNDPGAPRSRSTSRGGLIVVGLLIALVGLGLIVWPFFSASWILVVLFGSVLIVSGIGVLVRGRGAMGAAVAGIALILAGIVAMAFTGATARVLVSFAGFGLMTIGLLWTVVAARIARSRRGAAIAPGIVLLAAGILAFIWPSVALSIAAVVGGGVLILIGATLFWRALRGPRPADPAHTTIIM